jgi:hypothetical protein
MATEAVSLEEFHLAAVDDQLEGTRLDEYILGDRRYWAAEGKRAERFGYARSEETEGGSPA